MSNETATSNSRPARRRALWRLIGLVVVVGFGLLAAFVWLSGERTPEFQHRPLMDWAADLNLGDPVKHGAAEQAIRVIGTNGLPTVVRALQERDSHLGQAILGARLRLSPRLYHFLYRRIKPEQAALHRRAAARALEVLGPDAAPAADALGAALSDPQMMVSTAAVEALAAMGKAGVPALAGALGSASPAMQTAILDVLGRLGPEAAAASPAVKQLMMTAPDENVTVQAARTLGRLDGEDAIAPLLELLGAEAAAVRVRGGQGLLALVNNDPRLLRSLLDRFPTLSVPARRGAAQVLSQVTTFRRPIALTLARALTDPDEEVRRIAAIWLRTNFNEADLGKLVKNEPTPVQQQVHALFAEPTAAAVPRSPP
ncbi:MAG: HEAT repeat domain-containing protein [Verrucomicrobiota bacterium]